MNNSLLRLKLLAAAAALLLAVNAGGTSMVAMDVSDLTAGSDAIVMATVKRIEPSRWVGEGPEKLITTRITLEVGEVLKGSPPRAVTLVQRGGQVGDIAQRVDGLAEFKEGESIVVFLNKTNHADIYEVHGMSQGKFTVEKSSDGKMTFVVPSAHTAQLVDRETGATRQPAVKPKELKEFRKEVRAALKAHSKRAKGTVQP